MSEVEIVKSYFASKYIHASSLWIEKCIEWYKSENLSESTQDMLNVIYEQWLLSDLRDIELGCLPENLKSYKKIILSGKYAVQMHYLIDESKSAYAQLQKIRNVNTENENIVHDKQELFTKISAKRVLKLVLCDGVQEIKGMEYKTIKTLNTNLTPGTKMIILGPVECRRGVLLLEESHIRVLGGEIEDLICQNAYENVLARIVNLPENPNPNINKKNENVEVEITDNLDFAFEDAFDDIAIGQLETQLSNIQTENRTTVQRQHNIQDFHSNISEITVNGSRNIHYNRVDSVSINQNELKDLNDGIFKDDFDAYIESELRDADLIDPIIVDSQNKIQVETINVSENRNKINSTPEVKPTFVCSLPFVYIKQLKEKPLEKLKYTVKARVNTLVSKLNFINDEWSLKVEIMDASDSMTVDFSNAVLEELIGYTAIEMPSFRQKITTSNFHKDQLLQALEKAKKTLLSIDCLMDLDFSRSEIPSIVSFKNINYSDLSLLEKRVTIFSK